MSNTTYQTQGIVRHLPVFYENLIDRLDFSMSWLSGNYTDFDAWRTDARTKLRECFLTPPPECDFDPVVIGEEDRGTHIAQRVVINLSADSRVLGYLLTPKGDGPFPGVLLLHDHGGHFSIGKEKVVRPFDEPEERMADSAHFITTCYGDRYVGDELASRGYMCFVTDMYCWSHRRGEDNPDQEKVCSNLMHFGMSLAGMIAHEDLRALKFLRSQPKLDTSRVGAMGLSVGCYRTWQICAATDDVHAGCAICWLGTIAGQMQPGINQSYGGSAYVMLHPNLHNFLDYPDVASIACPKPMLFFNGSRDGLFPADDVQVAFDKMRTVWESQGVGDKLVTKFFDVEHEYSAAMQDEAFDWLDGALGVTRR